MFLEGILSISGQPGLFKQITQGKNNIIVESLVTGKRMPAFITARISALQDVAIYTTGEEKPLVEVLINLFKNSEGKQVLGSKSDKDEMIALFAEVLPDYDSEKVYVSDIKKIFSWYNLLVEKEIITEDSVKETEKELEKQNAEDENEKQE
ncbi:MAG TPA: DUF5606 domain-containing protein [Bacteroidales bacterium]|jgi:hypothetical protein|nr:DUF5606 domain-containing protein [Bacteroidales bacterium]MDD4235529.1 DUF5606 domain-containing protein [Bacteroidales bacterium]MDY0160823.1 DUF5606 domain-containing protein [Bacteroidales bacterium]HXK81897.1 DUF5606 domain-containing protein [Bacteroidales bacterium]